MSPPTQLEDRVARFVTFLITSAIKLGGLALALHELLLRTQLRPIVLAEASFMMAGAQIGERLIFAVLDRLLLSETEQPPTPRRKTK